MGRKLVIIWAGRHRRSQWDEIAAQYRDRLQREIPVVDHQVRPRRTGESEMLRRRLESRGILAAVPEDSWIVALDAGGSELTSEQFAARLERQLEEWPNPLAFLVGSDVGLDDAVLDRAHEVLSLSRLTLRHELARLVLYEQLYRAMTLRSGINYHRSALTWR